MGLCATPIWARKQLRTRVIEGVSNVEGGVTGCAGWSLVYRLPDVPSADRACARPSCRAGGAHDGRCPMGRGNHTMILPIYHELNGQWVNRVEWSTI